MTDRYHSLNVVLDVDIRDDDAQKIIQAISQIRHVEDVRGHVSNIDTHMAEIRAKRELADKILSHLIT